jgi:hypothetical protein
MTASVVLSFALGTLVFGVDALLGWAGAFAVPRVQDHFHNASFAGLMARGLDAEGIYVARITAALGVVLTLWAAIRSRDIDLTWLLLMAGALLWSPLGWIYYGWFLMPPLVALGATGGLPKLAWIGVVLWLWPPYTPSLAGAEVPIAVTVGSVYFWGLFLIWVAAVRAARFQTLAPRDSLARLHLDGSLNKSRPGQTLPSDSGGPGSHPPISPDDPALPGRSGSAGSGIHLDGGGEEGSTGEQEGRRG